ncbi:hypothetical protein [uncultured Jatrophihabitans sp.]|uniref:hypothetical protein n=1 Tax=uncultured Jatrophihabitans sp. TaxID=1610747 RepID=UPI0035C988BF
MIVRTAERIRLRLSDLDLDPMSDTELAHWRGMLIALEHALGQPPSLDDGEAAALLAQLTIREENHA